MDANDREFRNLPSMISPRRPDAWLFTGCTRQVFVSTFPPRSATLPTMPVTLPLDEMTVAEKLRAMEAIWDDLCHRAEAVPSPAWHGEILAESERLIAEGKASFSEWEEARGRIA